MSWTIYGSDSSAGPYTLLQSGLQFPQYFETGLGDDHTRYYKITQENHCGSSALSDYAYGTTVPAPTGFHAVGNINGYIHTYWSAPVAVAGETVIGYRLYVYDHELNEYFPVKDVIGLTTNDYFTAWDRSYTYFVTTLIAGGGESGPSNTDTANYDEGGIFDMERGTLFQGVQWGPETVPGTAVAATQRILAMQADPMPNLPVKSYKPQGSKIVTATQQGKEMTDCRCSGIWDFNLLAYVLAGMMGSQVPVAAGTAGYQYAFNLNGIDPVTPQTYTVEVGSALGASKFAFGTFTDLSLKSAVDDASMDATMIGSQLLDNITMTPALPTALGTALLPVVAVPPKNIKLKLGPSMASLTQLRRVISSEIRLNGHFKPAFFQDDSNASFSGLVETVPDVGASIVVERGSEADILIGNMRNDTLNYLQVSAIGPQISAGGTPVNYSLTVNMPVKVDKVTREDHNGVYGDTYDLVSALDPSLVEGTMNAISVILINKLATLS